MLNMEDVMKILELHKQGYSKSAISRETGRDWKTVDKYLRNGGTWPEKRPRNRTSKLDGYKTYIEARLKAYPRLSAVRLYEEIQEQGYQGKLSILRDYIHRIKEKKRQLATVRFETIPGEQMQCDFGHFGKIWHYGQWKKLYAFVAILGYSRMRFTTFVLSMDLTTLLRSLKQAFAYFGGIPRECLFDRMKTVVLRGTWNEVVFHPRFLDFAHYHGFRPRACKPYRAQTKGKVEKSVDYVRGNFFYGKEWQNLADINHEARLWCDRINGKVHSETNEIPLKRLEQEHLAPLPEARYDASYIESRIVSKDCRIRLWGNKYSVSHEAAGKAVTVKVTEQDHVTVYDKDLLVAHHDLCLEKGKTLVDPVHQEALLKVVYKRLSKPSFITPRVQEVQIRDLGYYEEVAEL